MDEPERSVKGALTCGENFRAFLFYSGAFLIGVFWELVWCCLKPYFIDPLSNLSKFMDWFMMISLVGGVIFSMIFGVIASLRQSSKPHLDGGGSILMFCAYGLVVLFVVFSVTSMSNYDYSENAFWVSPLMLGLFSLMILIISGFTATFFVISSHFSNQVISKSALPFWSGLGQITVVGIIHLFSIIELKLLRFFTILVVGIFLGAFSSFISMGIVSKDFSDSAEKSKRLKKYSDHSLTNFMRFFEKKDFEIYFSGKVLLGPGLATVLGSGFVFLIGFGVVNFSETETDLILDYATTSTINLKARFFQHLCQVISSILMFSIECVLVKYGVFRKCFKMTDSSSSKSITVDVDSGSDSDPVSKRNSRRLSYYVNQDFEASFYSHFCTLLLSWTIVSVVGLVLGLLTTRTSVMTLFGLGMMGFGNYFIQSGREYQRSAMRMARHVEGYTFDMNSVAKYEFFDNIIGAGFYSVFIGIGQTIGFFISKKMNFKIPIKIVLLWIGYSGIFVLVPLIVSCGILIFCNGRRTPELVKDGAIYEGKRVIGSKVILQRPPKQIYRLIKRF